MEKGCHMLAQESLRPSARLGITVILLTIGERDSEDTVFEFRMYRVSGKVNVTRTRKTPQ
jgi:hypothetical protein